MADNIREAQKAVSRAEMLQLHPIDAERDPTAKQAFEDAEAAFVAEAEAANQ